MNDKIVLYISYNDMVDQLSRSTTVVHLTFHVQTHLTGEFPIGRRPSKRRAHRRRIVLNRLGCNLGARKYFITLQ